jgi:hypothetical protein
MTRWLVIVFGCGVLGACGHRAAALSPAAQMELDGVRIQAAYEECRAVAPEAGMALACMEMAVKAVTGPVPAAAAPPVVIVETEAPVRPVGWRGPYDHRGARGLRGTVIAPYEVETPRGRVRVYTDGRVAPGSPMNPYRVERE